MNIPPELFTFLAGLAGSVIGVYVGVRLGIQRLELNFGHLTKRTDEKFEEIEERIIGRFEPMQKRIDDIGKRVHTQHRNLLVHDFELEDVMRKVAIPRNKRNWRLDD